MGGLEEASLPLRLLAVVKMLTVEPAIFIQTFTWGLQGVISQDLLIAKVCRDLGYNKTMCSDIDKHTQEENNLQEQVASFNMKLSMLDAFPSILLALFVGPWSDRNGRKPVMLLPMVGFILSKSVMIANIFYWEASANYLLASSVDSFFGGCICLMVGVYSYLADISCNKTRTTRIGILEIFMLAGAPAGTFTSAYIFKFTGYYGIFLTAYVLQAICFLYIALFIRDTRGPSSQYSYPEAELQPHTKYGLRRFLSIFDWHQLKDVVQVTIKKRQEGLRSVILLLILLMLTIVAIASDSGITYLYTRKKLHWGVQEYTQFSSTALLVSGVSIFIALPILSLYWKLHDATIGILSTVSKITKLVIFSLASNGATFFAGAFSAFLGRLSAIVIRSMLSKFVSKSELGKVFSLLATLEAAVPLFAAPLFTFVYNNTLETFPGAVFLVQASLLAISCCIFVHIYINLNRSGRDYGVLVVEQEEDYLESVVREENRIIGP